MTSREFNRDTASAKRTASEGPVVVTDRDRPAHVLMTWEHYQALTGDRPTPMGLIADHTSPSVDLPLPERSQPRETDLEF